MTRTLSALFMDTCRVQHDFMNRPGYTGRITEGSTPTLFFGSQGFEGQPVRVLTVGYNPSEGEFSTYRCLATSGQGADVRDLSACGEQEAAAALEKMRDYFEARLRLDKDKGPPWTGFFPAFEELLRHLDMSYFRAKARHLTAHVDVLTPFASKTIRQLRYQTVLDHGRPCFREVLNHFPDIHLLVGIGASTSDAFRKLFGPSAPARAELPGTYIACTQLSGRKVLVVSGDGWFNNAPFKGIDTSLVAQGIRCLLQEHRLLDFA